MKVLAFLLLTSFAFGQSAHYHHNGKAVENDLQVTPGDVRTTDVKQICSTRTGTVRNVSAATKKQVYALYGVNCGTKCGHLVEVDHLISLEIGGSNDVKNLWPEPYSPIPGAHQKDILENKLHKMICDGTITPEAAQKAISQDWYGAYRQYVTKSAATLGR